MRSILLILLILVLPLFSTPRLSDFSLETVDGKKFQLSDYLGRQVILINFFATWCVPCRAEMQEFQKLYEEYREKGFIVISISIDQPQTMSKVASFVESQGFTFPVLLDKNQSVVQLLNVSALPTNLLVNKEGEIVKRSESYQKGDEELWRTLIKTMLEDVSAQPSTSQQTIISPTPFFVPQLNASNFLRSNYGKELRNDPSNAGWLEDWLDFRLSQSSLSYKLRFRTYQFLRDLPDSRVNSIQNPTHRIVRQNIQYNDSRISIQGGNIYTLINQGLILRTWDDRLARIDRDLLGILAAIKGDSLPWIGSSRFSVLGGRVYDRFINLNSQEAEEENNRNTFIQGIESEVTPVSSLKFGAQYIEAFRKNPGAGGESPFNARLGGGNLQLKIKSAQFTAAYVHLTGEDKINYPYDYTGRALYYAFSFPWKRLTANFEYKYYVNYDLDFTSPPNLLKYHTFRLMARNLLFSNNQREEGGQLNLEYRISDKAFNNVNLSYIESHPEKNPNYLIHHILLPFLDVDNTFQFSLKPLNFIMDLNYNQHKRFYELNFENVKAYSLGLKMDQPFLTLYQLEYFFEFQQKNVVFNEFLPPLPASRKLGAEGSEKDRINYQQGVFTLSLSKTALWNVSFDYEITTNKLEKDPDAFHYKLPKVQNGWLSLYLVYAGLKNNQISLWAGQRKQRVVCS